MVSTAVVVEDLMAEGAGKALAEPPPADSASSTTAEEEDERMPSDRAGSTASGAEDDEEAAEEATGGADFEAPVSHPEYAIVGSWDEWLFGHEMKREGDSYWCGITLGARGEESFQILKDGRWEATLHPDTAEAGPHVEHALKGPDSDGHDLNWTIRGAPGRSFKITLRLDGDGLPHQVVWDELTEVEQQAEREKEEKGKAELGKAEWAAKLAAEEGAKQKAEAGLTGDIARASGEALKWYSQRMAEHDGAERFGFGKKSFGWCVPQANEGASKPAQEPLVRMELERDLGLEAGSLAAVASGRGRVEECSQCLCLCRAPHARHGIDGKWYCPGCWGERLEEWRLRGVSADKEQKQFIELKPTFGYAGSLDERPPFAWYDVRDEVCLYVGGFLHGQVVRTKDSGSLAVIGVRPVAGKPRLWFQPLGLARPGAGAFAETSVAALRARLTPVAPPEAGEKRMQQLQMEDFEAAQDPDGEEVLLCPQCRLPLGDIAYQQGETGCTLVHGECMAQMVTHSLQREEEAQKETEAELKRTQAEEFDIGWKVERAPRNAGLATKLLGSQAEEGMCCLLLQEGSNSVTVAATLEPAASVNLEYLSLALNVRVHEGKEPMFSLDPADASSWHSKQVKRFEPEWLAGTTVGEVMFQADYHLKELSMGEHAQPVVGMKSCFDYSEEEGHNMSWNAREWFVVKKAEMQVAENGVLVPQVKMGVEAREQVMGPDGLEDVKFTRKDHPLVKYADAFSHYFDLIAERRSVVYHLRELAKASVMAKFLLDAEVALEEPWFDMEHLTKTSCCLEVPQIWNSRNYSQVHVQYGKIVDPETGRGVSRHGVYGGVDFGVSKFKSINVRPRAPVAAAVRPAAALSLRQRVGWTVSDSAPAVVRPGLTMSSLSQAVHAGAAPRGVDLNLDEFDLSAPTKIAMDAPAGDSMPDVPVFMGHAFWSNLTAGPESVFKEEDKSLLMSVFSPSLSDRRAEGDRFVPPDTSSSYLQHLRHLVEEEEMARSRRKDFFLSSKFTPEDVGPFFPSSWTSSFEIARGRIPARSPGEQGAQLHARPDYKAKAHMFDHMLKSASPAFDKSTEDGLRFRIYKFGSLEVRTTQAPGGEETIGAVFSARPAGQAPGCGQGQGVRSSERVAKVTEYVEKPRRGAQSGPYSHHSYVVIETDRGNQIVTERLMDGTVTWEENPADLEDRHSLAKVVRSADCGGGGATVRDVRSHQPKEAPQVSAGAPHFKCKDYAHGVYCRAANHHVVSGFRHPTGECRWLLVKGGEARRQCAKPRA